MGEQTTEQCKKILFSIGLKLGVSPNLISTRLLSTEDKTDMLNGLIETDSLLTAVKVWVDGGMRNYSDGSGRSYNPSNGQTMQRYRGNGHR